MNKFIKYLGLGVFIVYLISYISVSFGYNEYKLHEEVVITNEKIKLFEEDVKNNKDIDLVNYTEEEIVYDNNVSNFIYMISNKGDMIIKKGFKKIIKRLIYLVSD